MEDEAPIIGSPQSIVNKAIFADLLSAQIKVLIFFLVNSGPNSIVEQQPSRLLRQATSAP